VRDLTRAVRRHRGLVAGGLVAGAVALALPTLAPAPPVSVQVLAAAHDLAPGLRLSDTDVRLLGAGLVEDIGTVAAPVRLADPATAALLHAGDHVDVLATPSEATPATTATTIARDLRVLAVPVADDTEGALVVLAAAPAVAARLAGAAIANRLSVTVLAS
jgi:hypothetical protein